MNTVGKSNDFSKAHDHQKKKVVSDLFEVNKIKL